MKLILRAFLVLFLFASSSISQTVISGGNVSGTWTAANSPYQVQSPIRVPLGQNLTIEPGTIMEFHSSADLRVIGNVTAIADSANPIVFTAENTILGWRGLRYDSVNVASDSSIFEYCTIEYGTIGGLMRIHNFDKIRVENCLLQHGESNTAGGIYLNNADGIFKNNLLQYIEATYQGGAFYISGGAPLIQGNEIAFNHGGASGGAVHIYSTEAPQILDNYIHDNIAVNGGAILTGNWCKANIENNVFENNSSIYDGGVLYCNDSEITVSHNVFRNNSSDREGGAVFLWNTSDVAFNGNLYDGNEARFAGAVFVDDFSEVTIHNETFINNYSWQNNGGSCGALKISGGGNAKVVNCTFSNNYTIGSGGAVEASGAGTQFLNCSFTNNRGSWGGAVRFLGRGNAFVNCTFANNLATSFGGAVYADSPDSLIFNNCIFWGNQANSSGTNFSFGPNFPGEISFVNCDIEGDTSNITWNGHSLGSYINNIDSNPLFVAPSAGLGELFDGVSASWQLSGTSPCINAGTPDTTGLNMPLTDLAGNNRIIQDTIDQGAYETVLDATIVAYSNGIQNICEGDSIILFAGATGIGVLSYQWQKDNLDIPLETNDTLIITGMLSDIGDYRCIVTNTFASDTSGVIPVVVHVNPTLVSLGADIENCVDISTSLIATDGPFTVDWNNGLSSSDTLSITTSGTYFYSVVDTNMCQAQSDSILVTINPLPVFDLGIDLYQCGYDSLWITSPISNVTFDWNNGAGSLDSIGVVNSGIVQLIITDNSGCTYQDSIDVTMYALPVINLPADDTICGLSPITLDAGPAMNTYNWNSGTSYNQTLVVNTSGQYYVWVTNNNLCGAGDTVNFVFHALSPVNIGPDQTVCIGDSVQLDAGGNYADYDWNNGLASTSSIFVQTGGQYSVLTTDTFGCQTSDTVSINLAALPVINLGNDKTICDGDSTLVGIGPAYMQYDWNNGYSSSPSLYLDSAAIWHLTVIDNNGCIGSDTMELSLIPLSPIDIGADQSICDGDSILLIDNSGFVSYDWNNGYSSDNFVYAQTDGDWIIAALDTNGCIARDTMILTVNPLPVLSTLSDTIVCINHGPLALTATPSGGVFAGTGVSNSSFDPVVADTGYHFVTYSYTDGFGCSAIDSFSILVDGCAGVDEFDFTQLQINPNPTTGMVVMETDQTGSLQVFDNVGRLVHGQNIQDQSETIDLSYLSPGAYRIVFSSDTGGFFTTTVIKQ